MPLWNCLSYVRKTLLSLQGLTGQKCVFLTNSKKCTFVTIKGQIWNKNVKSMLVLFKNRYLHTLHYSLKLHSYQNSCGFLWWVKMWRWSLWRLLDKIIMTLVKQMWSCCCFPSHHNVNNLLYKLSGINKVYRWKSVTNFSENQVIFDNSIRLVSGATHLNSMKCNLYMHLYKFFKVGFFEIFDLAVQINLPLSWQTVSFFLSWQTYKTSKGSNIYFLHYS